ncbi:MAG: hypothetical protein AAGG44_17200 [Planctomycetota bacterium]
MAPRLTVVVSQSAQKNPVATDLEETLVAELMMKGGMDATMIGPLQYIQTDDTDFLCLSSFNYNFALISWLPADETQEQLSRLGLPMQVVSLADPSERSEGNGKRVLHLQLEAETKLPKVMSTLSNLLAERAVKPVGITGIGISTSSSTSDSSSSGKEQPAANSASEAEDTDAAADQFEEVDRSAKAPSALPRSSALETALGKGSDDEDDGEWGHLEQLVDDLDDADL